MYTFKILFLPGFLISHVPSNMRLPPSGYIHLGLLYIGYTEDEVVGWRH